ncbi:MAG TPA: DUF167 domain-containing protein [Bacillota bacterium]|nr:DUF167 domain-containing protein [Bacillota bacterium]
MKIKVKTHPNSSKKKIIRINEKEFEIWINESAKNNEANIALIKLLTKYFKKEIKLISGVKSRNKIFEVIKNEI